MWLYVENGRVSIVVIEEILLFNVIGPLLRTGFEDAFYEQARSGHVFSLTWVSEIPSYEPSILPTLKKLKVATVATVAMSLR